jgi:phosphoglycerate dehydrogenase-like enzyme
MGATAERPPPGIHVVEEVVDLAYAANAEELPAGLEGADVLFAWRPSRELLEPAWESAGSLEWIQSASAGVDGLVFPAMVEHDVVLTNARGCSTTRCRIRHGLLLLFARTSGVPSSSRLSGGETPNARASGCSWSAPDDRPRDRQSARTFGMLVGIGRRRGRRCVRHGHGHRRAA